VVIAQTNLNADSINLLRETGITVLVDQAELADTEITAKTVDEAVAQIKAIVQL
jgi:sulfate adenylyltransferase subunit 1